VSFGDPFDPGELPKKVGSWNLRDRAIWKEELEKRREKALLDDMEKALGYLERVEAFSNWADNRVEMFLGSCFAVGGVENIVRRTVRLAR
jgi:hypothetical protein